MTIDTKPEGFFAIDLVAFRCAAVGGLNSAVAHLIMARGTGPDNRTTQWSVHSIEKRTGISRPKAKKAVKDLLQRGIAKQVRDGAHPIYELMAGDQIPGAPFTIEEQKVIKNVQDAGGKGSALTPVLSRLEVQGFIYKPKSGRWGYKVNEAAIQEFIRPVTVWLPNALIDGAADEVAPLELIRQTRSLPALRLLIELYAVQFLPSYGGVPYELLKEVFDRAKIGEQGPYVVWGFRPSHHTATTAAFKLYRPFLSGQFTKTNDGAVKDAGLVGFFWPAVKTLKDLGLVELVGMLLEGGDDEAEIIHPFPIGDGEFAERELALSATKATRGMITDGQFNWANENGYSHIVPVQKHIANVTMVGIYRLKYRPHTAATAAWYALMQQSASEFLAKYRAIIEQHAARKSVA